MWRFCALALLSAAPLSAFSQADSALPAPVSPPGAAAAAGDPASVPTGRLTGHVFCDDTRSPARGALVTIVRIGDGSIGFNNMLLTHVRTDGTFSAEHLAPGNYSIFATLAGYLTDLDDVLARDPHMGYTPAIRKFLEDRGTVGVRENATSTTDLHLTRGAALSGQILYADGSPAPSVDLILEDAGKKTSGTEKTQEQQADLLIQRRLFHHETSQTDDKGRFRLAGVRPGKYRLAATLPVWGGDDSSSPDKSEVGLILFGVADPRALRVYAGDTVHRSAATTFDLRPGDEVSGVDILIPLGGFHDIRGSVLALDGRAINMGQLTLKSTEDDQLVFHSAPTADGTFTFQQIPPGTYALSLQHGFLGMPVSDCPGASAAFCPRHPIAAFSDTTISVVVPDGDLDAVRLSATEVPISKAEQPADDR